MFQFSLVFFQSYPPSTFCCFSSTLKTASKFKLFGFLSFILSPKFLSYGHSAGVNMSLLSKVMSPRLSRGVFNCGFLSTEAGTLARTMADGLITVMGWAGEKNLLNFSMIPTFLIVVVTTIYTWIGYFSLY